MKKRRGVKCFVLKLVPKARLEVEVRGQRRGGD